ncbi:MAG: hypothetical protein V1753_06970 [Pseudomonadota bacterium]
MLTKIKTKVNKFLWTNKYIQKVCSALFVKECFFEGLDEKRTRVDPRYTNPLYPEFISQRNELGLLKPVYQKKPASITAEHPLYKYVIALGLISAILFLCLSILYFRPSSDDVTRKTPKTFIPAAR